MPGLNACLNDLSDMVDDMFDRKPVDRLCRGRSEGHDVDGPTGQFSFKTTPMSALSRLPPGPT